MTYEKKIASLTVILAVILALLAYLFAGQYVVVDNSLSFSDVKSQDGSIVKANIVYVELTKEVSVKDTRNLVTDRFSQEIETDGQLIVLGKDGSIKSITSGVVLVDNNIISVNEEESVIIALEKRD
ncbi:MAG: hypothetical protein PF569_03435 [Candidatus Woesearchaeota archaeon]|jgi:hypothetical protein|nr:hypothetical protein [Candidatus Woesearchaeota archaeon]